MKLDLLFSGGLIVFPDVGAMPGSVGVKDGRIAAILEPGVALPAERTVDCTGRRIMPGVIDPHVHFGFVSPDTDFATESRYHRRGVAPERIAAVLSRNAARMYTMPRKGMIAVGDA